MLHVFIVYTNKTQHTNDAERMRALGRDSVSVSIVYACGLPLWSLAAALCLCVLVLVMRRKYYIYVCVCVCVCLHILDWDVYCTVPLALAAPQTDGDRSVHHSRCIRRKHTTTQHSSIIILLYVFVAKVNNLFVHILSENVYVCVSDCMMAYACVPGMHHRRNDE